MNTLFQTQQPPPTHQHLQDVVQVVDSQLNEGAEPDAISMSQSSMQEELCPLHPSEMYVAYDNSQQRLVCNQCIYQSDCLSLENAMSQLSFTSYLAGNLKDLFDSKFSAYRASLDSMQQIAPTQITKHLESTVDSFFKAIESQIKRVENQTLLRIRNSNNLADLEKLLANCEPSFGHADEKTYELARQEIDSAVKRGSYSEVVGKKDVYEGLMTSMN